MPATVTIQIFVNRRKLQLESSEISGRQLLAVAGFGEGYDLLQLQGEGDPTGGIVILADQVLKLKNGEHFRVIPGNRTFGA